LPCKPLRQWVLSLPFALRFLLATNPRVLTQVLRIVYRTISGDLLRAAGRTRSTAETGAVTLIQRFGSAEQRSAAGAGGTGIASVKLPGLLATVNVILAALHAAGLSGNVGVAVVAGVAA